jgi:hypothetical protein
MKKALLIPQSAGPRTSMHTHISEGFVNLVNALMGI